MNLIIPAKYVQRVWLKVSRKIPNCSPMSPLHLQNDVRKLCALVAVTLILPALAYAGHDRDKDKGGEDNGKQNGRGHIEKVPEGGPGIVVLITTVGAILFFAARRPSREKAVRVES